MSLENQTPQSVVRRLGLFFSAPIAAHFSARRLFCAAVFCLVLWILSPVLRAQSVIKIEGRVLDAETGEPLVDANVQILGTALGAASDIEGRFFFENLFIGSYRLRLSFIGYDPAEIEATVTADMPARLTVRLKRRVIELPEVRVDAEREPERSGDAVILTRADIVRSQAATVGEVLRNVPGVEVVRSGAAGARETVSIRGSNAKQVLVLLDDVRLNDELTGEADLSQIPLQVIERIEIIRSGGGMYGGGAVGGVIRLLTMRRAEARLQIGLQSGSFGFRRIDPSLSGTWQRIEITAAGQMIDSRGDFRYRYRLDDQQTVSADRINADFSSANLFGMISRRGRHGVWCVKGHRFTSERGQPGSVFSPTPYARSQTQRSAVNASYARQSDVWALSWQASWMQNHTVSRNEMPEEESLPFGPVPRFAFENHLRSLQMQTEVERKGNDPVRFGVQWSRVNFSDANLLAPAPPIGRAGELTAAAFIAPQFRRTIGRYAFHADPSLRLDYSYVQNRMQERIERQWSPLFVVGCTWGKEPMVRLRGAVGRSFRTPTFADLFYQDFRVQGQADLLPEKSRFAEGSAGVEFRLGGKWNLELRRFRNRIDNMIVWRLGSFEFFRPFNTDAELSGWEAQIAYALSEFNVSLYYAFQQPLNKTPNVTLYNRLLPYRARETYRADLVFDRGSWQAVLQLRAAGKRFVNEANTKSLPPYQTADLTLRFRPPLRFLKAELGASVFNLFNARYELVRDMPLPGREIRLGFTVTR